MAKETETKYRLTDCEKPAGSKGVSARGMRENRRRKKEEDPCPATDPAVSSPHGPGALRAFSDLEFAGRIAGLRRKNARFRSARHLSGVRTM